MGKSKGFDMGRSSGRIQEVNQKVEKARGELGELEQDKQELEAAISEVEGTDLDEGVKQTIREAYAAAMQEVRSKGEEISEGLNEGNSELEEIRQDVEASKADNAAERSSVENKKQLLDHFGLGGSLDSALGELESNEAELDELNEQAIEAMRNLQEVSGKLSGL